MGAEACPQDRPASHPEPWQWADHPGAKGQVYLRITEPLRWGAGGGGWPRGEVATAGGTRCGLPPGWQAHVWAGQRLGGVCCWGSGLGVDRGASVLGAESRLWPQPAPLARGWASSPGSAWGSVWLLQAGGPRFPASLLPPAATIAAKKPLGAGAADPPLPQASSSPARPPESRSAPPVSGPLGPQALVTGHRELPLGRGDLWGGEEPGRGLPRIHAAGSRPRTVVCTPAPHSHP